ncbi:hypothetical protein [Mesorhizobium sp.]|nr:hypothetical protein [Mesorhizobium sp.]TIQ27466.1 MAG: hypothetical protein E5X54_21500 [Mesorhizobium sp.]
MPRQFPIGAHTQQVASLVIFQGLRLMPVEHVKLVLAFDYYRERSIPASIQFHLRQAGCPDQ